MINAQDQNKRIKYADNEDEFDNSLKSIYLFRFNKFNFK